VGFQLSGSLHPSPASGGPTASSNGCGNTSAGATASSFGGGGGGGFAGGGFAGGTCGWSGTCRRSGTSGVRYSTAPCLRAYAAASTEAVPPRKGRSTMTGRSPTGCISRYNYNNSNNNNNNNNYYY